MSHLEEGHSTTQSKKKKKRRRKKERNTHTHSNHFLETPFKSTWMASGLCWGLLNMLICTAKAAGQFVVLKLAPTENWFKI